MGLYLLVSRFAVVCFSLWLLLVGFGFMGWLSTLFSFVCTFITLCCWCCCLLLLDWLLFVCLLLVCVGSLNFVICDLVTCLGCY